jgi:hypothetical protein
VAACAAHPFAKNAKGWGTRLKKTKELSKILDRKDESALFELANNFAIRHHNPDQKTNYDRAIWYSWMFHFYLATYHAAIRLLIKHEQQRAK